MTELRYGGDPPAWPGCLAIVLALACFGVAAWGGLTGREGGAIGSFIVGLVFVLGGLAWFNAILGDGH